MNYLGIRCSSKKSISRGCCFIANENVLVFLYVDFSHIVAKLLNQCKSYLSKSHCNCVYSLPKTTADHTFHRVEFTSLFLGQVIAGFWSVS